MTEASATAKEDFGALVEHGRITRRGGSVGPLSSLPFMVKDLFDIEGVATGAGNPHWLATHPLPTATAPAIQSLLDAGAVLAGKTSTDELAWSLSGENAHYGTPVNPRAPQRIPGGSSSGSVVAVAGGLVPFSIGTDTGGSVRLPASFCGVIGMRPTYGRIPLQGAVPLAPSYDTLGWFARDANLFSGVGRMLLNSTAQSRMPRSILLAQDLFDRLDPPVREALAPAVMRLSAVLGPAANIDIAGGAVESWRDAFRTLQAGEIWATHGEWVMRTNPVFGPGVRERFAAAQMLTPGEIDAAAAIRAQVRARMDSIFAGGAVLILPTTPGIAPLLHTPAAEVESFRSRSLELLCIAGHCGLPQISLPLANLDGCPLGISLMAGRQNDEMLMRLAEVVMTERTAP